MATTSSSTTSPPAPAQRSAGAAPRSTMSIWLLAPINPLEPPFYLAQVPSCIVVAAADAASARQIAAASAFSIDAEAWMDEGLSSCDVLAPAEPGIVARDFSPYVAVPVPVDLGPPPVNKDVPHLQPEGTVAVGTTLTCTMGNWDNMSAEPHSYALAWQSDGAPNSQSGETYAVLPPDIGHVITCVVTATNAAGSTVAPPSNAATVSDGA
jgi:hypothetical protein